MAGIQIKNPTTVATVGGTVGTTSFATDCIEVVLRSRKTNTHAVHLNIQNADAGDVNPTDTRGNAITLDPTDTITFPVHGNAQVPYTFQAVERRRIKSSKSRRCFKGSFRWKAGEAMADKETKFITKDGQGYTLISQAAKSAIRAQSISVATSGDATQLPTTPLSNRKAIYIKNFDENTFWIGADANVTSSNGYPIKTDQAIRLELTDDVDVFAKANATATAKILEVS